MFSSLLLGDYSFKVAMGKHEAHKPLLPLLQSPDPDVQVSYRDTISHKLEFKCALDLCPQYFEPGK